MVASLVMKYDETGFCSIRLHAPPIQIKILSRERTMFTAYVPLMMSFIFLSLIV